MTSTPPPQEIVIRDVRMRFGSMVIFMVKWAIAAIPALMFLVVLGAAAVFASWTALTVMRSSWITNSATPTRTAVLKTVAAVTLPSTDPIAAVYVDKVALRKIQVSQSVLGRSAVYGEIKNQGDRTLKEVEITIFCLGADGKPVFEKTAHPVLVSEYSFGASAQPLKPGYSRQFGVDLNDAPSDWAKKVDVKVTKVEFQ